MKKTVIAGRIGAEAFEFVQSDLVGCGWLKRILAEFLSRNPDEAHDAALLLFKCMQMRVGETVNDES